jgi:hypothetical protein
VTRTPGWRLAWIIARGHSGTTEVRSKWVWDVGGIDVLFVEEEPGGLASQPVIRPLRRQ